MFDIALPELLVVGAVALVAIGPKDLPKTMHTIGVWAGKVRRAYNTLQHDFERFSMKTEALEREKTEKDNPPPTDAAP